MNLIRLEWVNRMLPDQADIGSLHAAVLAAGSTAEPVLVEARLEAWLRRLIRLVERRAHELLPDGDFRATCAQARRFAAAVRCLNPAAAGEVTEVRVGANGTIPLPGTGLVIELPRSCAGLTVRIRASARLDRADVDLPGAAPGAALVRPDEQFSADEPLDIPADRARADTPVAPPASRQGQAAAGWAKRWIAVGGRLRTTWTESDWLPGAIPELGQVLADLGCPDGVRVNKLADLRQRADPSIDHLSLLFIRDRQRYDSVVSQLDAAPDGDVRQVLLGHRAYVEGEMSSAAAYYAGVLVRHPHDVDLWRDFTFAVRHLGDPVPGETWLFHASDVVARAVACVPDLGPLTRLVPAYPGQRSPACRFLLGLLEWVRHDLDRR